MDKKKIRQFEQLLLQERNELLRKALKSLREDAVIDKNELPDEIDQASSEYLQSMSLRLRDREKSYLRKIDIALEKISAGSFGICEQCDEAIGLKRLTARPVTTLCIRCKEDQEREERSYSTA